MYRGQHVTVIIPALNEAASIRQVIEALPDSLDQIIVCDNGSTDNTMSVASDAGARVITEPQKGYGAACLKAVSAITEPTEILLFVDADYSDFPEQAPLLLDPIIEGRATIVIGSRTTTTDARKALTPLALFGNWLSTSLIRLFWGARYTDLGPFRAVTFEAYQNLHMRDQDFGWTVEMQIRAAKLRLPYLEIPVSYRARIGKSKISGTVAGSIKAGIKILYLIGREALS